jgi:hypothetical protein
MKRGSDDRKGIGAARTLVGGEAILTGGDTEVVRPSTDDWGDFRSLSERVGVPRERRDSVPHRRTEFLVRDGDGSEFPIRAVGPMCEFQIFGTPNPKLVEHHSEIPSWIELLDELENLKKIVPILRGIA